MTLCQSCVPIDVSIVTATSFFPVNASGKESILHIFSKNPDLSALSYNDDFQASPQAHFSTLHSSTAELARMTY
jgi:hypothetical protein